MRILSTLKHRLKLGIAIRGLLFILALVGTAAVAAPQNCAALGGGARVGDAAVILAQHVNGGDYVGGDGAHLSGLSPFCRVLAVATPSPSSHILVELWMPDAARWNGRLLAIGNGGEAGKIGTPPLSEGLKRGYATATTDMGSSPAAVGGVGFNFGNGRPEQIRDFGWRSTHSMTVLAKTLIAHFYGSPPAQSYFNGCSTGGQQALSEAQKFPDDYDGIIAGAPANDRTHLHIHFSVLRQFVTGSGAAIPMPLMAAWRRAIISACGGRDGGAPGDDFLTNPLQCTISPRQLSCASTAGKVPCLTGEQAKALEQVYGGVRNRRTGLPIYFPDVRGAEELFFPLFDPSLIPDSAFDITHWILPPERPSSSFDLAQDMTALDDAYARDVNAMDPDLSAFAAHGGKLIIYHGWADGVISPLGSIDYYRRISTGGRAREDVVRLFLVPGMGHCAGGPGATDFGQLLDSGTQVAGSRDDILIALEHWVEAGVAPDRLIAGKSPQPFAFDAFKTIARLPDSRPICAFPALPRYDGKGNPLIAASFSCVRANYPDFPAPPPEYLR